MQKLHRTQIIPDNFISQFLVTIPHAYNIKTNFQHKIQTTKYKSIKVFVHVCQINNCAHFYFIYLNLECLVQVL